MWDKSGLVHLKCWDLASGMTGKDLWVLFVKDHLPMWPHSDSCCLCKQFLGLSGGRFFLDLCRSDHLRQFLRWIHMVDNTIGCSFGESFASILHRIDNLCQFLHWIRLVEHTTSHSFHSSAYTYQYRCQCNFASSYVVQFYCSSVLFCCIFFFTSTSYIFLIIE